MTMRFLRLLCVSIVCLASGAATAATLTVSADKSLYSVGENIVFTVVGSSGPGEASTAVLASLLYENSGMGFVSSSQTQGSSFGGGILWTLGNLSQGPTLGGDPFNPTGDPDIDFAFGINQIIGLSPLSADGPVSGIVVLEALAAGSYAVGFNLDTADYFGAVPGGPALFTIVPEPTTAGLLGLGLAGLAGVRRRQR